MPMAKVVVPSHSGGNATTTDGWFDLVAAEVLRLARPNSIKSVTFTSSGSGTGATLTITVN